LADVERTERIIALQRSTVGNEFLVAENPLEKADSRLVGGLICVTDAANEEIFKHFCSEMELPRAW